MHRSHGKYREIDEMHVITIKFQNFRPLWGKLIKYCIIDMIWLCRPPEARKISTISTKIEDF